MSPIFIEWSAFFIGTLGTIAWACGYRYKGKSVEGWLWLISAFLWIWFAMNSNHNGLAARDLLGVVLYATGIIGSYRNKKVSASIKTEVETEQAADCEICYEAKLRATLNKPSKFPARTRKTPFFGFCGLLRRPFGPFAGP